MPPAALQRQFGRYYLLYHFATGGMANLYLARFTGPDGFEKLVAIKRIHDHLSSQPNFVHMFKDEARLAVQISHPNVAQVIELGEHQGAYYIAMEYVEGESLATLIRHREVPWPIGGRIVADALAGLHAAHELRNASGELFHLVHRDLSPSNVLIGYDGAVKVVDFGVARARGMLHTTEAGVLKGKFAYMSPEQARNRPVDRRSDIFAAGILLYEVTTRRRLFRAKTETAILDLVLKSKIPPPSSVVTGYPRRLETVVLRALQRDPRKRFATAREMQAAVEECIFASGSPVLQATVGDLMQAAFAEDIKAKRRLRRQSLLELSTVPTYEREPALPSVSAARPATVAARHRSGQDLPDAADPAFDGEETPVVNIVPEQVESMQLEWEAPRPLGDTGGTPTIVPEIFATPSVDIEIDEAAFEHLAAGSQGSRAEGDSQVVTAVNSPTFSSRALGPTLLHTWRRYGRLYAGALLGGLALAALILVVGRSGPPPEGAPGWNRAEEELVITASPRTATLYVDGRRVPNPCRLPRIGVPAEISVRIEAPGYETRQLQVSTARSGGLVIALRPAARVDAGRKRAKPVTSY